MQKPGWHRIYAVLLRNGERKGHKYGVYVGMTGLSVAARFLNHKRGYKSSKAVRLHGLGFMPAFHDHLDQIDYYEAKDVERMLITSLREQDIWVEGA